MAKPADLSCPVGRGRAGFNPHDARRKFRKPRQKLAARQHFLHDDSSPGTPLTHEQDLVTKWVQDAKRCGVSRRTPEWTLTPRLPLLPARLILTAFFDVPDSYRETPGAAGFFRLSPG